MRPALMLVFLRCVAPFGVLLAVPALHAQRPSAVAVDAAMRAAQADLWPGFDARTVPLAVFDGEHTWLFRHPAPPADFRADASGAAVMPGRHPAVVANTSADLGGTPTATVLLNRMGPRTSASEAAAVAVHEAFHVFQRTRHPRWQANELDLFTYPDEDMSLLAEAEQERRALQQALQNRYREGACHARRALALRAARYARMEATHATYERKSEHNEGLAAYLQARVSGATPADVVATPFTADVRGRVYHTGPALAFLLDRFAPGWRPVLDARDTLALDQLLTDALPPDAGCAAPADERAAAERLARTQVAILQRERARRFAAFDATRGTRLVVEAAPGRPLWPQNFDPYNLVRSGARVLHTRTVKVGNEAGTLTVFGRTALTEGAGAHPLFNGIARVVIAGLVCPEVRREGGAVVVRVADVEARITGAEVRERPGEVVVTLR